MFLIFLDTETTGLDPQIHRIIEIAFKILDHQSGKIVATYSSLVSHSNSVWDACSKDSLRITGLNQDIVSQYGREEREVAKDIENIFNSLNIHKTRSAYVCQNPSVDRSFFAQILSVESQNQKQWPYHWLDLASMFWALEIKNNASQNPPFLGALSKDNMAKFLGIQEEQSPHRALQGVEHLMACYNRLWEKKDQEINLSPTVMVNLESTQKML